METVTIQIFPGFPGQGLPTLTVAKEDWEDAKNRATNGEKVVLQGVVGGKAFSRQGQQIKLIMTGPQKYGYWDAKDAKLGDVFLTDDPRQVWMEPAFVYASEKTGLLVTEQNRHLIPEKDLTEWDAAIKEYESKQHRRQEGTG